MRVMQLGIDNSWALQNGETICVVDNTSYLEAIDCFAANHPEYWDQLEALRQDYIELIGEPIKQRAARAVGPKREKKRGSGARFRELIIAGKSNEDCLRIIREEFPDSKATLSDAAWNRAQIRKNPSGYSPDGQKI